MTVLSTTSPPPPPPPLRSWNDEYDHYSTRVKISAAIGVMAGTGTALLRGHHRFVRTTALTVLSCALCGTAVFGCERIVAIGIEKIETGIISSSNSSNNKNNHNSSRNNVVMDRWERTFLSHITGGGILGGGLLGGIYKQRPSQGIAFFVPLMTLIALVEVLYADMRDERMAIWQKQQILQQEDMTHPSSLQNDETGDTLAVSSSKLSSSDSTTPFMTWFTSPTKREPRF
jgi:hypothetical protein